ncbi:MAG: CAP domain-containing protein [Planctomycetota bacterium]
MRLLTTTVLLTTLLGGATDVAAQTDWQKKEDKIANAAVKRLTKFVRTAQVNDVLPRMKEAYEVILRFYDPNHEKARKELEYTLQGDEWVAPRRPTKVWPDDANDNQRFRVIDAWQDLALDLSVDHRDLGVEMMEEDPERAERHLEIALYYNPFDIDAHKALGHEELDIDFGDGSSSNFWGDEDQVAFVQKLREIEEFAANLAKKDYEIETLDELPPQLQRMVRDDPEIQFHGAKSENFTVFCRGTQENANDCVLWAERGADFITFLLPERLRERADPRKVWNRQRKWVGYLWTVAEQEKFIELNPEIGGGMNFANISWVEQGGVCEVARQLTPTGMHDSLIAKQLKLFGGNDITNEGLMHAMTWYLRATAITRYGAESTATTTGAIEVLPESANWWLRAIRDQATARTDFPVAGIPRVQLSDVPNRARLKTWSFSVWLLARYPDKWFQFLQQLPESEKRPTLDEMDAWYEEFFDRSRESIEEEWRAWASGRNLVAYATGYGPPLLPEKPNKDQIKGLERLNEFRALLDLSAAELDLEATLACKAHALFLQQNESHWKWPEAHEEDPAKPGFTTRGMRAGLNSVIVIAGDPSQKIDPAESLDGWIGTVYHRFPLLEENVRRIGFAAEENVVVLDMGSLGTPKIIGGDEAPRQYVAFPADNMRGIPLRFHVFEVPDPLEDTDEYKALKERGASERELRSLQQNAGYPISLQLMDVLANRVQAARMEVHKLKKLGRNWQRDGEVELWVHTPRHPLLKRQENPSVVFGIPKEPLEKREWYQVTVTLTIGGTEQVVQWKFETGSQNYGHGRLAIKEPK